MERYGLAFVFVNVLLVQLGAPLPLLPTLVIAGALAAEGKTSATTVFVLAFIAAAIAHVAWYVAGRRYGHRVLKLLCRISLSPDSCVQQTQASFDRWGALTLALGKFVPALSTVAQPLAGAMRMPFLLYSVLSASGIALWTAVVLGAGMVFHLEVDALIARGEELGRKAVIAVVAMLAAYVAFKWWERWRFYQALRMARITVEELREKMTAAQKPIVVDLRPLAANAQARKSIPGAITMRLDDLQHRLDRLPAGAEIVFLCNCPNEASAASAAKQLMGLGYKNVRPLLGGLDAWIAAGYELEDPT